MSFYLAPFPADIYPDLITVYALGSGSDPEGTPNLNTLGSAIITNLAASVQKTESAGQGVHYQPTENPFGATAYEVATASDPGVAKAEQRVYWTSNRNGVMATPIVLIATGAARPPNGIGVRWSVSTERRD